MKRASALAPKFLFRGVALLVLGAAAYFTILLAVADHLSRSALLADRQRAVRLLPRSGAVRERLAELQDDSVVELQRAAEFEPANAKYWERLGTQAEIAGDIPLAEQALLGAAVQSRLYQPRYLLAQYYYRRGDTAAFTRWLKAALDVAPGDVRPLLDLAWRSNGAALAGQVLSSRPLIVRQIITFSLNQDQPRAARPLAEHLAQIAGPDDMGALLGYASYLLAAGDIEAATAVWNTLCNRRLLPYSPNDTVTNADFAHGPVPGGFDWHFEAPDGVVLRRSPGALSLAFAGNEPEVCMLAWQYLRLHRGHPIRVIGDLPSGLSWMFFVPRDGDWKPWSGNGPAPAELARLTLMYRRPSGVPRLQGTVTVPPVRVEAEP